MGAQKPEPPRAKPLTSISGLDGGCTAARPTGGAPHFPLSEAQRTALDVAVARPEPDDLLTLTMKQLNCFACHQRGDLGGVGPQRYQYFETVGHVDLGDEGRIPPPLDYVGAKLTRKWLENVFQGKGSVRPHFRARMPSYNALAKSLASQFKATDTHWDLTATPPEQESDAVAASNRWLEAKPRPSHIEQGRQLMDIGCVQCHPIGGEHLPGVIGVDLANLQERIEPAWLHAFLLDPAKLKSNTRMPTFFPGGRSSNQQIYGGDVDRQISAIWAYLNSPSRKLPDKLEQGKAHNFELKPADQPMVVRTFMKKAGTHAIAVGFPEQLHFAVDAERGVVTQLWKGRFLNAHSTWFNRFVPPTQPLGKVLVLPPSAIVGEGESPNNLLQRNDPWRLDYRGYELDKQRVPTFLYRRGDFQIRERLAPANGKMRRRIEVKGDPSKDSTLWISLAAQVVRLDGPNIAILPSQGRVVLQEDRRGQLVKRDSDTELLAPLPIRGGEGSLEATYQW